MIATIFVISYVWTRWPYESRGFSVQEILNELIVLIAAYPLLSFTDWEMELERRF